MHPQLKLRCRVPPKVLDAIVREKPSKTGTKVIKIIHHDVEDYNTINVIMSK